MNKPHVNQCLFNKHNTATRILESTGCQVKERRARFASKARSHRSAGGGRALGRALRRAASGSDGGAVRLDAHLLHAAVAAERGACAAEARVLDAHAVAIGPRPRLLERGAQRAARHRGR